MESIYRFRNIDQLLGTYKELETQTIYFASAKELNDPMEGLRDIVWNGDEIVWTNLFKNYIYCLILARIEIPFVGDDFKTEDYPIDVHGRWDEPITPEFGTLFSTVWEYVYERLEVSRLIMNIASITREIRRDELQLYLTVVHYRALVFINRTFAENDIIPHPHDQIPESLTNHPPLLDDNFFQILRTSNTTFGRLNEMFIITSHIMDDMILSYFLARNTTSSMGSTSDLSRLMLDFPRLYIQQLETLLWPDWYTACFTKDYKNSSMWSRYTDGHHGVCLIFSMTEGEHSDSLSLLEPVVNGDRIHSQGSGRTGTVRKFRLLEVQYSHNLEKVDFFRNMGRLPRPLLMSVWYTNEEGSISECTSHIETGSDETRWRDEYWNTFNRYTRQKTKDWEYEQECRLVTYGLPDQAVGKDHRAFKYDFVSLKGIIFGINTSYDHKIRIMQIIHRKCQEVDRQDFTFFQAYYSHEQGRIRRREMRGLDLGVTSAYQDENPV